MYILPTTFAGLSGNQSAALLDADFSALLAGVNNAFLAGPLFARPAVSNTGLPRYYFATDDNGGTLYRDPSDGTAWQKVAASVAGAFVVTSELTGLTLSRPSPTSLTVAVGAAASDDAVVLSRVMMNLPTALTGTTAGTWVVGAGQPKLDVGVVGVSQWWHVFLIARMDTGVVDFLLSLNPTTPTLPTSYTKQRRIGSIFVDGAGLLVDFVQDGDYFRWAASVLDYNANVIGTAAVLTALSVPSGVPVFALLNAELQSFVGAQTYAYLSDPAVSDEAPASQAAPQATLAVSATDGVSMGQVSIRTNTLQQIRLRLSASAVQIALSLVTLGWFDHRDRG